MNREFGARPWHHPTNNAHARLQPAAASLTRHFIMFFRSVWYDFHGSLFRPRLFTLHGREVVIHMSKWFFMNAAVLVFVLFKLSTARYIGAHVVFGAFGLFFFLYNWTRHAVFSTIRSNISRERKIKFANLSKKVLPFHKYTGTAALLFIIIHATLVVSLFGFDIGDLKIASGFLAGLTLAALVISGWIRWFRTTYPIRIVHLSLGFTLFAFILLHLIL